MIRGNNRSRLDPFTRRDPRTSEGPATRMSNLPSPPLRHRARALPGPGSWSRAAALAVFAALCAWPYLGRLTNPSLYSDDVVRVEQLQTAPLGDLLFRPFNEHMAPLFQLTSWLSWRAAGRSLARAPLAFTVASYLPFLAVLGLLGRVVRRETRSRTTALAALAVFSLSWLSVETVFWYSASSFMAALACTLAAWLGASKRSTGRGGGVFLAAAGAAAAPAFSAVGLIAGPLGMVRALATRRPGLKSVGAAAAPLAGTLIYLTVCAVYRYQDVLADNLERRANIGPGLLAAARAPWEALLPGLLGLRTVPTRGFAAGLAVVLSTFAALWLLRRAGRRADERPVIAGGLVLIFGGYAMAFCARPDPTGVVALNTQRYHLFPMFGFVLLLSPLLRRAFSRWDRRPTQGAWAAAALAAVLLVTHGPQMRGRGRFLQYPDQTRTLAALDRLAGVCARLGVTREQALRSLDPVEFEWTPAGYSALIMLPECSETPRLSDDDVKTTVLAALSPDDRRSVCGGMDATPYVEVDTARPPGDELAVGRVVRLFRVAEAPAGQYIADGWPSFIEYSLSAPVSSQARAIVFDGGIPGGLSELWWRGKGQRWSEARSVRIRGAGRDGPLSLRLQQLPHWNPAEVERVRLLFHDPGPVAGVPPRVVR